MQDAQLAQKHDFGNAAELALFLNETDDWHYKVENLYNDVFVIAVYDEEGHKLGYL